MICLETYKHRVVGLLTFQTVSVEDHVVCFLKYQQFAEHKNGKTHEKPHAVLIGRDDPEKQPYPYPWPFFAA
eukprot:SAG31_NODE_2071_length_6515_cov_2.490804_8_plen_72_part_00